MKQVFTLVILLFSILGFSQNSFKEYLAIMRETSIAEYYVDLNHDKLIDTIKCKFPSNSDHPKFAYGDPGFFNTLEISITNGQKLVLKESFDTLPKRIISKSESSIKSDYLIFSNYGLDTEYLIVSGPSYGCCNEKLYVFKFINSNIKVLNKSGLVLNEIKDYNGDGKLNIIGTDDRGEWWGDDSGNYSFRWLIYPKVFELTDTLVVNKKLTADLNQNLVKKFPNFSEINSPIVVEEVKTGKETLEEYKNIRKFYYRKYPEASNKYLDRSEIEDFSSEELRIMRNEIFAAHGYIFNSTDMIAYFGIMKWYKPVSKDINDKLTAREKANINLILELEKELNAP
jgi:hypothetical protein